MSELDVATASDCYHCGQELRAGADRRASTVVLAGQQHPVCCPGCAAALLCITDAGLGDYYRRRERRPQAAQTVDALQRRWVDLDRSDALTALTQDCGAGIREVQLELADMSCAACAWLLESTLQQLPAVAVVSDLSLRRLRVRFDSARTPLSRLLATTASFGFPATPVPASAAESASARMRRHELIAVGVAGIGAMQVMMLAFGRYFDVDRQLGFFEWRGMAIVEACVASVVVLIAGRGLLRTGWLALWRGRVTIDAPLALGITAGWLLSLAALFSGGPLYFDAVTMLVFLTLSSRYLEARLRRRATFGQDSPVVALRVRAPATGNDKVQRTPSSSHVDALGAYAVRADAALRDGMLEGSEFVPASLLMPDDLAWVRTGERVPADGVLASASGSGLGMSGCACDEAALSGESQPVAKRMGDPLFAGTLNVGPPLLLQVQQPLSRSRLHRLQDIARTAEDARALQPAWADRAGHVYGLVMLVVAALAGLYWHFVAPAMAVPTLLSILVIACPCALAVAMPATIAAANSGLLRRGALVTRADVFDRMGRIDTVLLDKTGTLTQVQSVRCIPMAAFNADAAALDPDAAALDPDAAALDLQKFRAMASALEQYSHHPYARLLASAPCDGVGALTDVEVQVDGVQARIAGATWRIGSARFDTHSLSSTSARMDAAHAEGGSGIWLTCNGAPVARFDFQLELNPGVPQAIAALRARGWALRIASGDNAANVADVARRLAIEQWDAGLRAEEKTQLVERLQREGRHVLMVGDGTNDAAALACANVGVAVAPGTALCQSSAGARLLRGDLRLLIDVIDTALRARRIMHHNMIWALAYNAFALPLAAAGLVTPLWAAVGMSASSLVVLLNALQASRAVHAGHGAGELTRRAHLKLPVRTAS